MCPRWRSGSECPERTELVQCGFPWSSRVFSWQGPWGKTFGPERNLEEAAAGYAIALCLFAIWRLLGRSHRQTNEFITWLFENRDAIKAGTAEYNGLPIDEQTELTQYQLTLSVVVVTITVPSRFYVVGQEPTLYPACFFTAVSLVLGWWGIPFGPIYTIVVVISNLRGGKRSHIGELLGERAPLPQKAVVQLTERAAENARRIMTERGFSEGTALQVDVTGHPGFSEYSISYDDLPPSDGSVLADESYGVTVIVHRRDERRLTGLLIDFVDGQYTFKESGANVENRDF